MRRRFLECDLCGDVVPENEACSTCYQCDTCCECFEDLFDADELGLDPEEDARRKYGEADA